MKNALYLMTALFIDGLQAAVSWGLAVLAAFPGTTAGAAAGCAAGNYVAGQFGCWAGGLVVGFLGSWLNPFVAPYTIPIGIALAFAINFCISATLGSGFVLLLGMDGMFYPKYIFGGGLTELLPGFNNIPAWTAMTLLCILKKRRAQGIRRFGMFGGSMGLGRSTQPTAAGEFAEELAPNTAAGRGFDFVKDIQRERNEVLFAADPEEETVSQEEHRQSRVAARQQLKEDLKGIDGIAPRTPTRAKSVAAVAVLTFLFLGASAPAHAQTLGSQPAPVQYIVAPEAPGPNQFVSIEAEGVGGFLGESTITWQQNGATVSSGIGQSTFTFTTGGVGSRSVIRLIIDSPLHGRIERTFVFYPSLVTLIWEADTSAPPLYLSKPLYSTGSRVRVVAFPTIVSGGTQLSSNQLSFQWSVNDTPVTDQSGLGKHTITFNGSSIQNGEAVSVDVFLGATKVAHGEVFIPAATPQIVLYPRDPLRGTLYDAGLTNAASLGQQELTLQAEPYFFANSSKRAGMLSYTWTLNGKETVGPDSPRGLLTLRQTGTGTGSASVGVSVQNVDNDKFTQAAETMLRLTFGNTAGSALSSFFGL